MPPVAPVGRVPELPEPEDARDRRPISLAEELDETVAQIEELQATPFQRKALVRAPGQGRLSWLWAAFKDSLRNYRDLGRRLAAWWRHWRTTASFRVLAAFIVLYALLAYMRAPSDVVVEQSRHAEEIAFLQDFLRDYRAAGGVVLAERPHGGTELYPRGVVLQGDLRAAFLRAPVGTVFVVHATSAEPNLLGGFYGYPPVFLGGSYFQLERKFNFALYRFSYLIRKDSEQAGAILLARVELAH